VTALVPDRLTHTVELLDIALVLERAGVDPRHFTPAELRRLQALLLAGSAR
jgi:hypothetical protein